MTCYLCKLSLRQIFLLFFAGRKFDKNGDIKDEQWTSKSIKNFCDKSRCLIKQYNKYKVRDKFPVRTKTVSL